MDDALWSTCKPIVINFSDARFFDVSVDYSGQYAVLGGRRELVVLNLDNESDRKRYTFQTKWETYHVQWSPHESNQTYFVSARNNRAELWQWQRGVIEQLHALKGHSRAISAIDWSSLMCNTLATGCVDGSRGILIWDIRDTKKHSLSFDSLTGISQLRWNKLTDTLLASSHESEVRIWDIRKGSVPLQFIAGHTSKVYDLDWFGTSATHLVTVSQDSKMKLWDLSDPQTPLAESHTPGIPIYRVLFAPFGQVLTTIATPHHLKDLSVTLWSAPGVLSAAKVSIASLNNVSSAVATTSGALQDLESSNSSIGLNLTKPNALMRLHQFRSHTDVLLSLTWRQRRQHPLSERYQLVTLSRDRTLRLWPFDSKLLQMCGGHFDLNIDQKSNTNARLTTSSPLMEASSRFYLARDSVSSSGSAAASPDEQLFSARQSLIVDTSNSSSPVPTSSMPQLQSTQAAVNSTMQRNVGLSRTLHDELNHLSACTTGAIRLEDADMALRRCVASVTHQELVVRLQATFPTGYPLSASPVFSFLPPTMERCPQAMLRDLLRKMQQFAYARLQAGGMLCLQGCLTLVEKILRQWQQDLLMLPRPEAAMLTPDDMESMALEPALHRGSYQHQGQVLGLYRVDDLTVPFPRTSGARFSASGYLVIFRRRSQHSVHSSNNYQPTPKSFRELTQDFGHHHNRSPPTMSYNFNCTGYETVPQLTSCPPPETVRSISDYYREQEMQTTVGRHKRDSMKRRPYSLSQRPKSSSSISLVDQSFITLPGISNLPSEANLQHLVSQASAIKDSDFDMIPSVESASTSDNILLQPLHMMSSAQSAHGTVCSTSGSIVEMYNWLPLTPLNRKLAETYSLDTDNLVNMCQYNAKVAAQIGGRYDLEQMWNLLSVMAVVGLCPATNSSEINSCGLGPWASLPFGRSLIFTWIEAAQRLADLQTLGMLALTLTALEERWNGSAESLKSRAIALNRAALARSLPSCSTVGSDNAGNNLILMPAFQAGLLNSVAVGGGAPSFGIVDGGFPPTQLEKENSEYAAYKLQESESAFILSVTPNGNNVVVDWKHSMSAAAAAGGGGGRNADVVAAAVMDSKAQVWKSALKHAPNGASSSASALLNRSISTISHVSKVPSASLLYRSDRSLAGIQLHLQGRQRSNSCNGAIDEVSQTQQQLVGHIEDNMLTSLHTTAAGSSTLGGGGSSWGSITAGGAALTPEDKLELRHAENCSLIDEDWRASFDTYLQLYGNLLYSWGMLVQRTRLLKALSYHTTVILRITAQQHQHMTKNVGLLEEDGLPSFCGFEDEQFPSIKPLQCAVCTLSVRGLLSMCSSCQHGGHPEHLRDWFSAGQTLCAAGCGCHCASL